MTLLHLYLKMKNRKENLLFIMNANEIEVRRRGKIIILIYNCGKPHHKLIRIVGKQHKSNTEFNYFVETTTIRCTGELCSSICFFMLMMNNNLQTFLDPTDILN